MASLRANASIGNLRVYGPSLCDEGALPSEEREQDTSLLRLKIEHHRDEAMKVLASRSPSHPDLPRFLDAATCVGLLDPVSNILVSAMLATGADPVVDGDMEQRSFDGLVAFLICFFPHLTDWESVRYLRLAEADPLVAARIVMEDRRTTCFRPGSAATNGALKLALKCAAVAAKYPCPSKLAGAWLSMCSSLEKAVSLLSASQPSSPGDTLHTLAKQTACAPYPVPGGSNLIRPWELAAGRGSKQATKVTHQYSWSLRRVLLHTIHGFYLQALARMPGGELRSRYHHSMLKAGHCYGPFDPVTNIIVNTVWYGGTFPPLSQLGEFDIVGTLNLMRIETQSLYGLVSFLCTRDKDLNADQAIRFLLDTDLNLATTVQCSNVQEEQEAFRAAAIAAWHRRPDAQAGFLSSCKTPEILSLLSDNEGQEQLSSQCVQQLAMLLSSAFHSTCIPALQKQPVAVYQRVFNFSMSDGRSQRRAHKRISRKVKAALRRYEMQNWGHTCYQLHVVCGVNESVSGPHNCDEGTGLRPGLEPNDDYYHHAHVNFLVTRNVAGVVSAPVLFFAELSNHDDDTDSQLLCCPVDLPPPGAEPVRCLFCEQEGIRIVHPASGEGFHGHEVEFEKMVRGEDLYNNGDYPEEYDNDRILSMSEYVTNTVAGGIEEEDCMYLGSNDFTIKASDGHESDWYGED